MQLLPLLLQVLLLLLLLVLHLLLLLLLLLSLFFLLLLLLELGHGACSAPWFCGRTTPVHTANNARKRIFRSRTYDEAKPESLRYSIVL